MPPPEIKFIISQYSHKFHRSLREILLSLTSSHIAYLRRVCHSCLYVLSVCLCMCVCMWIRVRVRVRVRVCVCVHVCVCVYVCVSGCV